MGWLRINILVIVCERDLYKLIEFIAQRASDYIYQVHLGFYNREASARHTGVNDYKMYSHVSCFIVVLLYRLIIEYQKSNVT
jgi:hypothetical protein